MTTTVLAFIPSPSQGVWHLFGVLPIRAYALCIITGIVAALVIGDRRWEARGGERGVIYDIALWAVPFGLIGGRLYHVLTDWSTYFGAGKLGFVAALRIWDGGLGIWGAVALGAVGAWIGCRIHGVPLQRSVTPSRPESSWPRPSGGWGITSTRNFTGARPRCPGGWRSSSAVTPAGGWTC